MIAYLLEEDINRYKKIGIVLMNINSQDRYEPVILSAAKNLGMAREILRCAQNDIPNQNRECPTGIDYGRTLLMNVPQFAS